LLPVNRWFPLSPFSTRPPPVGGALLEPLAVPGTPVFSTKIILVVGGFLFLNAFGHPRLFSDHQSFFDVLVRFSGIYGSRFPPNPLSWYRWGGASYQCPPTFRPSIPFSLGGFTGIEFIFSFQFTVPAFKTTWLSLLYHASLSFLFSLGYSTGRTEIKFLFFSTFHSCFLFLVPRTPFRGKVDPVGVLSYVNPSVH